MFAGRVFLAAIAVGLLVTASARVDPNRRNGRRTSRANAPPATAADYYANIDKSLSGNQFRAQLTELIGDHSSISYGALWDAFEVLGNGGQPGYVE